jgi:pilus assembly protein Flp/PilA
MLRATGCSVILTGQRQDAGMASLIGGEACQQGVLREGSFLSMLDRLFHRTRGQGLVEYALIIALVAIVVIGILLLLGPAIGSVFSQIKSNL